MRMEGSEGKCLIYLERCIDLWLFLFHRLPMKVVVGHICTQHLRDLLLFQATFLLFFSKMIFHLVMDVFLQYHLD